MTRLLAFALFVFLAEVSVGQSSDPEQVAARQWLDSHLTKCDLKAPSSIPVLALPKSAEPGLDVYANNDPVILKARGKSPLKIGDRTFSHGLYCHAVSKVVVHLPSPGKRFSARAGLDHNEDTAQGRGSVVFSVTTGDKTVFRSDVMRFGTPARGGCGPRQRAIIYSRNWGCRRRNRMGPVGLGRRQSHAGRWPGTLAGRTAVARSPG